MPDPVVWGFKAIKPFDAEQPIGSGKMVHYNPGDEVPAGEWGRAEGFMVEAGTIMRYARNVSEVSNPLPPTAAPATVAPAGAVTPADTAPDGEAEEGEPFPQKQAGGWYLLSSGEKVRGKAAALAAQAELDVAAEGASEADAGAGEAAE